MDSFNNNVRKIKDSLPKKETEYIFDIANKDLFTEEEQVQLEEFKAILPPMQRKGDIANLTDEQIDVLLHYMQLESVLLMGDNKEARRLRMRHNTPLSKLIEMFLNLDVSKIPDANTRTKYNDLKINYVEMGKAYRHIEEMWQWVELFEL